MKKLKVLSALSLLAVAGAANAEISGSMGIASTYLWRGHDLGPGTPAVSGDLHYSNSGFYGGIWGSSGDTTNGTEYDLYAGYGGSAGIFTYDASYWTYSYPTAKQVEANGEVTPAAGSRPGNLSELVLSFGVGPASAFLLYNINAPGIKANGDNPNGDYQYYGLKYKVSAFNFVLGHHNNQADKLTHFDTSYAYNDNLSFTVSIPVSVSSVRDPVSHARLYTKDDPTFVVSYTVPFGK